MNLKTWILGISIPLAMSSALLCNIKPSEAGIWSRTAARGGGYYTSGQASNNEGRSNLGLIFLVIGVTGGIISNLSKKK